MSTGSRSDQLGALYGVYACRLERTVEAAVPAAPRADVADACSFAWAQLLTHSYVELAPAPIRWLGRTAIREAWLLGRRGLAGPTDPEPMLELVVDDHRLDPAAIAEQHERLAELDRLPRRKRRLLWLQGLGLSYEEMARVTGDTQRTVERQLRRAREGLRQLRGGDEARPGPARSVRS